MQRDTRASALQVQDGETDGPRRRVRRTTPCRSVPARTSGRSATTSRSFRKPCVARTEASPQRLKRAELRLRGVAKAVRSSQRKDIGLALPEQTRHSTGAKGESAARAAAGHPFTQAQQRMQRAGSVCSSSPGAMASAGQSATQRPQAVQRAASVTGSSGRGSRFARTAVSQHEAGETQRGEQRVAGAGEAWRNRTPRGAPCGRGGRPCGSRRRLGAGQVVGIGTPRGDRPPVRGVGVFADAGRSRHGHEAAAAHRSLQLAERPARGAVAVESTTSTAGCGRP